MDKITVKNELKTAGYKCYTTTKGKWGYIITPSDNVLYIQRDYFGGWTFSFAYLRSQQNGTGCMCLEKPVYDVSVETVKQAEEEGARFAHKLGAKLYSGSDA